MSRLSTIHDSSLFLNGRDGDFIYEIAASKGGLCIDGGAAAGTVTELLLKGDNVRVLSFEPFPGNLPHFQDRICNDSRVSLYQKALGSFNGSGSFYVSRVVDGNQPGWSHLQGYSSEGYLLPAPTENTTGKIFEVDVVRLEDYVNEEVTLLKLDLQGGEYEALIGLGTKLDLVMCCYIEFSLDWQVLDYLSSNNFIIFDTRYTGIPKKDSTTIASHFHETKIINLSNGYQAISGIVSGLPRNKKDYHNYLEEFKEKFFYHLWTDLIVVNERYFREFFDIALL